ncbi:hypothetical protein DSM26151_25590 [Agromyces marinus]|nr:hypothetical protein DSM26151_25590 [Agromyces marinus]
MSVAARTVMAMTNQPLPTLEPDVLDEPCLRCGSAAVRVIVYGPLDLEVEASAAAAGLSGEAPIFDCRDCGFEWGEAIRDLLA